MSAGPRRVEVEAPAKLNLGLRVTGRREDGYHEIDSLFVPLELADRVEIELTDPPKSAAAPSVALRVSGLGAATLPQDADNLAWRAAQAFLEAAGRSEAVFIRLHKEIPSGAGLGGGSSDAAAVLRGLDRVLPGALPAHRLAEIALRLGADVPFFLDPQPARVRGVGERVEPLAGLPALPVLLAHPGISVATAEVYADWDRCEGALTPSEPRPTMAAVFGPGLGSTALSRLVADGFPEGGLLHNDLEGPAVRLCPAIADLRRRIEKLGADAAGMSGSGATVFGLFRELTAARAALSRGGFGESIGDANWARVSATRPSL